MLPTSGSSFIPFSVATERVQNQSVASVQELSASVSAPQKDFEKGDMALRVDNWLDRLQTPKLSHAAIFDFCEALPCEKNWEMLVYALTLVQEKMSDLNSHIRLIWIIHDNLRTLNESEIVTLLSVRQTKIQICFHSGLLGTLAEPKWEVIEQIALLKRAIEQTDSPSSTLEVIQRNIEIWTKSLDQICKYVMPHVFTCREMPYCSYAIKVSISHLTSYLFENKKILKTSIQERDGYFIAISEKECSFIPEMGELKDGFSLCAFDELSELCQEEFKAIIENFPLENDFYLPGFLEEMFSEIEPSPDMRREYLELMQRLPPDAWVEMCSMFFLLESRAISSDQLEQQALSIFSRYLSKEDLEWYKNLFNMPLNNSVMSSKDQPGRLGCDVVRVHLPKDASKEEWSARLEAACSLKKEQEDCDSVLESTLEEFMSGGNNA